MTKETKLLVAALREAIGALNMCDNTEVNKETKESSYDIAAKIDRILKDYPEED